MSLYIQGQLQTVFDALYELGVIDPVLEKNWSNAMTQLPDYYEDYEKAMKIVNEEQQDVDHLIQRLKTFSPQILEYVAMEVGKEFADFHCRSVVH